MNDFRAASVHPSMNTLYYGDNLFVLRQYVADASVDLVYLDPPFNSNRNYNVLFAEKDDTESDAQVRAFDDTWRWDGAAIATHRELTESDRVPPKLATLMESMRAFLGENDLLAYLSMMALRLIELHRVLKPTGSLYLHCDPSASHYLKLVLDAVFGVANFRSEVIWKRTHAHGSALRWGPVHDTIFFYSRGSDYTWNSPRGEVDPAYVESHFNCEDDGGRYQPITLTGAGARSGESGLPWRGIDPTAVGRHWAIPRAAGVSEGGGAVQERLTAMDAAGLIHWPTKAGGVPRFKQYADTIRGAAMGDMWVDVPPLSAHASERLGYPTQKPVALLERILSASSNPGDVVLDPFCGCGTTIDAAQRLGRAWVGIDVTHLAIALIRNRLDTAFPGIVYNVVGEPKDVASARTLAEADPHQFEWWSLALIGARPSGSTGGRTGKRGMDRGIDGIIRFRDDPRADKSERIVVSVKSGRTLNPAMVRELRGTVEREQVPIGVFVSLTEPTAEMRREANAAGVWRSKTWGRDYPRLQLLTIEEALAGKRVDYPGQDVTVQPAVTAKPRAEQLALPGATPKRKK